MIDQLKLPLKIIGLAVITMAFVVAMYLLGRSLASSDNNKSSNASQSEHSEDTTEY